VAFAIPNSGNPGCKKMKRLYEGQRRSHVEMAGIEPASEEETIKATTYIVCLSELVPPHPTDRMMAEQPHSPALAGFAVRPQGRRQAILSEVDASSDPNRRESSRRTAFN
jgi:hypothetical protein